MNRVVKRLVLLAAVVGLATYWIGADVFGLWLPVKLPWQTYSQEYAPPSVTLADATQEEAAEQLLRGWLDCYKSGQTDPFARIRRYEIDSLKDFQDTAEGFMFRAEFDLLPYGRAPKTVGPGTTLADVKTAWISGNGVLEDGWVKEKVFFISVARHGDTYSVVNLGTGF